jgi:hypothetical protein
VSTCDLGFRVGGEKWRRVTLFRGGRGTAAETDRVKIGACGQNRGKATRAFFAPVFGIGGRQSGCDVCLWF